MPVGVLGGLAVTVCDDELVMDGVRLIVGLVDSLGVCVRVAVGVAVCDGVCESVPARQIWIGNGAWGAWGAKGSHGGSTGRIRETNGKVADGRASGFIPLDGVRLTCRALGS